MKSVLEKQVYEKYGDIEPYVRKNDVLEAIDKVKIYATKKQFTMEQALDHLRKRVYGMPDL